MTWGLRALLLSAVVPGLYLWQSFEGAQPQITSVGGARADAAAATAAKLKPYVKYSKYTALLAVLLLVCGGGLMAAGR